jgi:hypothetical protein
VSYFRRSLGDGPITHPDTDENVASVPPTRLDCKAFPSDSPWRQPGQVCYDPIRDFIDGLVGGGAAPVPVVNDANGNAVPVETEPDNTRTWLLLGAAGAAAYLLLRKKKRT